MPYESDHTRFMREWLQQHPEEVQQVKKGRALWWDKEPINSDKLRRDELAEVPQKAYYYDIN